MLIRPQPSGAEKLQVSSEQNGFVLSISPIRRLIRWVRSCSPSVWRGEAQMLGQRAIDFLRRLEERRNLLHLVALFSHF